MKTLADLRAVREKAKQDLAAREENAKFRIVVAMGTCGIAAGARSVMSAILDEMNKQAIKNTVITQTGCLGYCDQEPLVQIFEAGKPVVTYGKVNEAAARRIIQDHIRNDRIVGDFVFISH